MSRAYWPTGDPDHDFIERRIRYWTHELVGPQKLTPEDREDLAQEFRVDLELRLRQFDPGKASRRTFISRIIEHRASTFLEGRTAAKRDPDQEAHSLDAPIDPADSDSETHGEQLSGEDYHGALSGREATQEERHDLDFSVRAAISQMPLVLQQVCDLLWEGFTVTEIAAELNVHRSTAHEHKAEIRRRLKAAGFGR